MRFLADESCDFAVVRALRRDDHEVLAVSEFQQRSVDAEVMELAREQGRILLTEDKDFGWLCFVAGMHSPGVILIRFPASGRSLLAAEDSRAGCRICVSTRKQLCCSPARAGALQPSTWELNAEGLALTRTH